MIDNLTAPQKSKKVGHLKRALRYRLHDKEEDVDKNDLAKSKIIPGSLSNDVLVNKNNCKFPVNLQILHVGLMSDVNIELSDSQNSSDFLVSKKYSYLFENHLVPVYAIVTLHEVKCERKTKSLMITRMTIDSSSQVTTKIGKPRKI